MSEVGEGDGDGIWVEDFEADEQFAILSWEIGEATLDESSDALKLDGFVGGVGETGVSWLFRLPMLVPAFWVRGEREVKALWAWVPEHEVAVVEEVGNGQL